MAPSLLYVHYQILLLEVHYEVSASYYVLWTGISGHLGEKFNQFPKVMQQEKILP